MSENSSPPVSISKWLRETTGQLPSRSPRLDALVLLSDILGHDKAWILSHDNELLTPEQERKLNTLRKRRAQHEPLAYIRGKQAFFGRDFIVTPDVLIPRPETEALVEQLLQLPLKANDFMLDVGTGSGIIAITAALEHPYLHIEATDKSTAALKVAQQNVSHLNTTVALFQSDLLDSVKKVYKVITANLPYVAYTWHRSPETFFEPNLALLAEKDGLALIRRLIIQSPPYLANQGFLLLEADPRQHKTIIYLAQNSGFELLTKKDFIVVFQKQG